MVKSNKRLRKFEVYTHCGSGGSGRVVKEYSFEGATVTFFEEYGLPVHHDEHEVTLYVRDIEEADSHCFKIDLDSGKVKECN